MKSVNYRAILLTTLLSSLFSSCGLNGTENRSGVVMDAVRIIDGDTFEGICEGTTYRIRLHGIDAPERGQAFYKRSKEVLGEFCKGGPLRVELVNKDVYGRWVGKVYDRRDQSINAMMVSEGMAWHYVKYSDDEAFTLLESEAKKSRKGLWSDTNPVAPWEYRQRKRKSSH
jgi:micrococcal nuclease